MAYLHIASGIAILTISSALFAQDAQKNGSTSDAVKEQKPHADHEMVKRPPTAVDPDAVNQPPKHVDPGMVEVPSQDQKKDKGAVEPPASRQNDKEQRPAAK